jgi:hypothetical protein
MSNKPDVMSDEEMAELDQQLESLLKWSGPSGISVSVIQLHLGDLALIRAGILVARRQLKVLGGGGADPFILAIEPNPDVIERLRAEGKLGDEDLRQWLVKRIEAFPELTTARLARSEFISCSRSGVEAYLRGLYFVPRELGGCGANPETSKLEEKIRKYRERVEQLAEDARA